jgi:hypothetical protein
MSELIKEVNHGERKKKAKEILMCAYFRMWFSEGAMPRPICTYLSIDYKGNGLVLSCCNPFSPFNPEKPFVSCPFFRASIRKINGEPEKFKKKVYSRLYSLFMLEALNLKFLNEASLSKLPKRGRKKLRKREVKNEKCH